LEKNERQTYKSAIQIDSGRNMIEALISSKTRVNILLKFFLNPECTAYLRELAREFGESTNGIRLELNRFEAAGMLESSFDKNRKLFKANKRHPLFRDVRNMLMKYTGIDQVIEKITGKLGNVEKVYLAGHFAHGRNSGIIDIILVGDINCDYLQHLTGKVEQHIEKKISYQVYPCHAQLPRGQLSKCMLLWNREKQVR